MKKTLEGIMTRNLTWLDMKVDCPAHPNLCFEMGEEKDKIDLVKRFVLPIPKNKKVKMI